MANGGAARTFRVGVCLGRGGFGEVYRATMRTEGGLETEVALKVLRSDLTTPDAMARFRDEGKVLARFQHPCVVRAHDWARLDGSMVLVTEYVDGVDVSGVVGRTPPRPALEIVAAIAAALDAAGTTAGPDGLPLRIVHRDLKPTNLRLGRHGEVKLLDFGIAVLGSADRESKTKSALIVGSLPYMAPERFVSRDNLPSVDVYGLGCCLFELLTGQRLHAEAKLRDLSALAVDPVAFDAFVTDRLRSLEPDVVRELCSRCLAHDPARRPSAEALAGEASRMASALGGLTLRRFCADLPPTAIASPGAWTGRSFVDGEELATSADGSHAGTIRDARETVHPDDPILAGRFPSTPSSPSLPEDEPSVLPFVLAGFGCLAVGALFALGFGGLALAATMIAAGM